jgi:hypothetical protein
MGVSLECLPRDHILPQVTPTEGWTRDWRPVIDELSEIVVERYPDANLEVLRQRLAPLLTKTVDMVEVGQPGGKKPATFIRDQIEALRDIPPAEAVKALQHPHPTLRNYLDLKSEAQNSKIDQPADPELGSIERAAKRYALVEDLDDDVQPQPRRGTENPWATVADQVLELLTDVIGEEPKRSWDDYAQADTGWSLEFFRRFAELAIHRDKPIRLDKVWRNALEARKNLKTAI